MMIEHNGRWWEVVKIGNSWFARDDLNSDTGPWATPEEVIDWIKEIRP